MGQSADTAEEKLNSIKEGTSELTYEALLLLIENDQALQQLIRGIAEKSSNSSKSNDDATLNAASQQEGQVETDVKESCQQSLAGVAFEEPLRSELSSVLRLLELVALNDNLNSVLLDGCTSEGGQLIKLLVSLGGWSQIEMIWDSLADDIKNRKQAASNNELEILKGCLQCFNLTNTQFKAALDQPILPENFNHKVHNRLNAKGQVVSAIALPGLINPAGDAVRKVLVITE